MSGAMKFNVKLVASPQLKANMARLKTPMADNLEAVASAGAIIVEGAAKHKVQRKTGTLSDSIHHETVSKAPTRAVVKVGTDLIYAAQREFGGFIYPKVAKVLHWVSDTGEDIFAAWVYQAPHPYLRPALDENKERVKKAMGLAWSAIMRQALK